MACARESIIIVIPEVPYPLRANGLSLRYLPIIERLSKTKTIDLLITGEHTADAASITALKVHCRNISFINYSEAKHGGSLAKLFTRASFFLPWTMPRGWIQYGWKSILQSAQEATSNEIYDIVICVTGYNYPVASRINGMKLITDFVDSPSLLVKRNVIGSHRASAIRKFEWFKLINWEAKIIRRADAVVYISDIDAAAVPGVLTPGRQRNVIPNGFSASEFTTNRESTVRSPNIGFVGNMSYYPNIEAVQWLHQHVYIPLHEKYGNLHLYIIGRTPDASVIQLARDEHVHVTGAVENIWPYLNAIDIFVFPLRRGAGLKNKILEALYAKRPVVTTPVGNEGLDAVSGRDLIVCKKPGEFRRAVEELLESPSDCERLGGVGHEFVVERFGWDGVLNAYERLVNESKPGVASYID
jgi:glycosyltransferase involved in cell wall biosynthesis